MEKKFQLTASQIKHLDEIHVDLAAADSTLRVALMFHSNTINKLKRDEQEWWKALAEYHRFDMDAHGWTLKKIDGALHIVPTED